MSAWIWGAAGAVFIAIEILAPGYFLIFPATAAFVVGLASFAPIAGLKSPELQLMLFAVLSGLLFVLAFRPYRRITASVPPALVNSTDRLVGALAVVEDAIVAGRGKVRLGDSVWLASGPDLPRGEPVVVRSVASTVLGVEARGSPVQMDIRHPSP